MAPRRTQPAQTPPDLPTEKAYAVLKKQLGELQTLKGRNYQEAEAAEDEWYNLTAKLVMRAFGDESPNHRNFRNGRSAGEHYVVPYDAGVPHALNQHALVIAQFERCIQTVKYVHQ